MSGQSRRSVDRSKFHLGDNASVAKIALNDRPSSSGQASPHFRESKRGRQGGRGQSAFGHFELVPSLPGRASGVRHSSTSVDAAPPSPQEVRVEWGRNLLGREAAREGESLFKWFRALSLTTPFCTHSVTGSGGRGRGDIKGFRNPKKAFKVLLYNADTKAVATHCDRRLDVRSKRSPSFSNGVRKTISNFHEKQSALCCHSTRATTSFH